VSSEPKTPSHNPAHDNYPGEVARRADSHVKPTPNGGTVNNRANPSDNPAPAEETGALVPFEARSVEEVSDPGSFVVAACQNAKIWLARALECDDIDRIAELKSQAEAIHVYTMQKNLGKEAELAAAEIVRRAEDGLGRAVRQGQERGEIRRGGRPTKTLDNVKSFSPAEYFANTREMTAAYATAHVPAERFEEALGEAKAEGNLSRSNVMRKATQDQPMSLMARREKKAIEIQVRKLAGAGHTTRYIASKMNLSDRAVRSICRRIGVTTADALMGRDRLDPNRIVNETVMTLENLLSGLDLVEFVQLDPVRIGAWVGSMSESLGALARFCNQLKEVSDGNPATA
jgi:hypothetical protein